MTFSSNIAASGKLPVYILEFFGNTLLAFESTSGWSTVGSAQNLTTSTTAKEGANSISFDKGTGNPRASIENTTLGNLDGSIGVYYRLWVNIPDLTDVDSLRIRLGNVNTVYYEWEYPDTELTAGWNHLYLSPTQQSSAITFSEVGTVFNDTLGYMQVSVLFDGAPDTLAGILVDNLTQHPQRFATGKVTDAVTDTRHGWMQLPSIQSNKSDPKRGTLSVGSASCVVVDDDSYSGWGVQWGWMWGGTPVVADLARFAFDGRDTEIKMGFRGEAENTTNYQIIHRGIVEKLQHRGNAWQFSIGDILRKFRVPFMEDATDGAPVTLASANPVDQFLTIALSTGNANNNPTYDTLSAARGAGISADLFDITEIEQERDDWMPTDTGTFVFRESQNNFLEWFFQEFCLAYGVVPVVKDDGRISVKVVRPAFGAEAINALTDANILAKMPSYTHDRERIINQVRLKHTYDSVDDEFDDEITETNQESVDRYGVRELVIESKGITDDITATRAAKRILNRLGDGAPPSKFQAFSSQQPRQLGETVSVTLDRLIPDLDLGNYGVDGKLCEIVERGYNPSSGRSSLTVAFTSFQQRNYRLIGPAAMGDYDGQTQAQKDNYGSISDGSGLLGTDNDPEHVIGPG